MRGGFDDGMKGHNYAKQKWWGYDRTWYGASAVLYRSRTADGVETCSRSFSAALWRWRPNSTCHAAKVAARLLQGRLLLGYCELKPEVIKVLIAVPPGVPGPLIPKRSKCLTIAHLEGSRKPFRAQVYSIHGLVPCVDTLGLNNVVQAESLFCIYLSPRKWSSRPYFVVS